jgi:hypothetical protein
MSGETVMPWLIALTLAFGTLAAAGSAAAAVYVPGHFRDGIYTRPHFLTAPAARYDREIKLDGERDKLPKPTLGDEPLPRKELPAEKPS